MTTWLKVKLWLMELALFCIAVAGHWLIFLGGSAMSTIVLLWEHAAGKPLPWSAIEGLMVASLILAMFSAWRDEKDRSDRVIANLRLLGAVGGTVMVLHHSAHETSIVVPMRVKNLGKPTIVSDCTVRLTVAENDVPGIAQGFSQYIRIELHDGTRYVEYSEDELLEPRGMKTPIATGGELRGIIFARFPLGAADVTSALETLRISFQDVYGRLYEVAPTEAMLKGRLQLIPGLGVIRHNVGVSSTGESASGPIT